MFSSSLLVFYFDPQLQKGHDNKLVKRSTIRNQYKNINRSAGKKTRRLLSKHIAYLLPIYIVTLNMLQTLENENKKLS